MGPGEYLLNQMAEKAYRQPPSMPQFADAQAGKCRPPEPPALLASLLDQFSGPLADLECYVDRLERANDRAVGCRPECNPVPGGAPLMTEPPLAQRLESVLAHLSRIAERVRGEVSRLESAV